MRHAPRRETVPVRPPFLAVADGLALLVFVMIGMETHDEGSAATSFIRTGVPLLVAWYAAAILLDAYRRPGLATFLRTWIVAVPAGIAVRSLIVGSPDGVGQFLAFLGVAMIFTLAFGLIGRGVVWFVAGWHREASDA